jgi:hypothetical protein
MNEKLFEYALFAMRESGGDGDVTILFKQQLLADVVNEFAVWAKAAWPEAMKKINPDGTLFYDGQECVHLRQWTDFKKFQRDTVMPACLDNNIPLSKGDCLYNDTIIVTW